MTQSFLTSVFSACGCCQQPRTWNSDMQDTLTVMSALHFPTGWLQSPHILHIRFTIGSGWWKLPYILEKNWSYFCSAYAMRNKNGINLKPVFWWFSSPQSPPPPNPLPQGEGGLPFPQGGWKLGHLLPLPLWEGVGGGMMKIAIYFREKLILFCFAYIIISNFM